MQVKLLESMKTMDEDEYMNIHVVLLHVLVATDAGEAAGVDGDNGWGWIMNIHVVFLHVLVATDAGEAAGVDEDDRWGWIQGILWWRADVDSGTERW